MKKKITLSLAVATSLYGNINLDWSREYPLSNTNNDVNNSITSSTLVPDGIVSVGSTTLNSLFQTENPPSVPDQNVFIMKHTFEGNLSWYIPLGASLLPDEAIKVLTSPTGGIYVVGVTAGAFEINGSKGYTDIFLARFENNGSKSWVKQFGTAGRDFPNDAVIDRNGDIYIAAVTDGNLSNELDSSLVPTDEYNSNYSSFILKFNEDGLRYQDQIIYPEKNYYYGGDDKKLALRVDEINSNRLIVEKGNYYYNGTNYSPKIELFDSNLTFINSVELPVSYINTNSFDFIAKDKNISVFVIANSNIQKIELNSENNQSFVSVATTSNNYWRSKLQFDGSSNVLYVYGSEHMTDQATGFNVNKIFIDKLDANSLTEIGARKYFGRPINNNYSGESASTLNIKDSNIFLTGYLDDLTLTNDLNVSGHRPFVAKFTDSYAILQLKTGWNLVSGNFSTSILPQNVLIAYQYLPKDRSYCEEHNSSWYCQATWKFFSPIEKIKNGMQSLNYIKEMDLNLQNRDGVWIYADSNITIKGGDNDDNICAIR